ncbi:MAG: hypothetical protein ACK4TL_16275 [Hyphomicrobiaceae bacterium]
MAGQRPTARRPTAKARTLQLAGKQPEGDARAPRRAGEPVGQEPAQPKSAAPHRGGATERREPHRLSGKPPAPPKKIDADPPPRKVAARPRAHPAAPLLASTPKRVGAISKIPGAAKSSPRGRYLPKTDLAPLNKSAAASGPAAINFLAMAQPWIRLGWQMTAAGFAMQARVAKAAMDMPPATTAMRQGTEALNAWLALVGAPRARKD